MKKFKFTINKTDYDVNITEAYDNIVKLEVNGKPYSVELSENLGKVKTPTLERKKNEPAAAETHKSLAKTAPPTEKKGAGVIKAPLPGTVISVLVKQGDTVKTGQKVLTYEAMKMENNIASDREGTIKTVKVKPGDTILEGDVLMEIE
jgi:biotin carboxyl carrier protein